MDQIDFVLKSGFAVKNNSKKEDDILMEFGQQWTLTNPGKNRYIMAVLAVATLHNLIDCLIQPVYHFLTLPRALTLASNQDT